MFEGSTLGDGFSFLARKLPFVTFVETESLEVCLCGSDGDGTVDPPNDGRGDMLLNRVTTRGG